MRKIKHSFAFAALFWLLAVFQSSLAYSAGQASSEAEPEIEKGPHQGRMLRDGEIALELSIFETGVPPEFRVWVSDDGDTIDPAKVKLKIILQRLGGVEDHINFKEQDDFLRGDMEIYEPHSFVVNVQLQVNGESYTWRYDNFEGRTLIEPKVAEALGIETEIAGPAVLSETFKAYGNIAAAPGHVVNLTARFEGVIKQLHVGYGQHVNKGDNLVSIESNESLKTYALKSPIDGVVDSIDASVGEQSGGRPLVRVVSGQSLLVKLKVFPKNYSSLSLGKAVMIQPMDFDQAIAGTVSFVSSSLAKDQSAQVLVTINDASITLPVGLFVEADIETNDYEVPLAVKRSGLQSFRDFTVVYAKVGNEYEVRMLELGREAGEWVEVLGGLKPGTEYVSESSYVIKADIEKSGASHDH